MLKTLLLISSRSSVIFAFSFGNGFKLKQPKAKEATTYDFSFLLSVIANWFRLMLLFLSVSS